MQVQNAVTSVTTDVRQAEARMSALAAALSDASSANVELRSQLGMLSEEVHRGVSERAAGLQQQVSRRSRGFGAGERKMCRSVVVQGSSRSAYASAGPCKCGAAVP